MTRAELNAKIRALCEERRLTFMPWEQHPADVDDGPCPWPESIVAASWRPAQRLRAKLIKELEGR